MQFGHKLVSSQQKLADDFIHFKLIILNFIKTKLMFFQSRILSNNRVLVNAVLIYWPL